MNLPLLYSLQLRLMRLERANGPRMEEVREALIASMSEDVQAEITKAEEYINDTVRAGRATPPDSTTDSEV